MYLISPKRDNLHYHIYLLYLLATATVISACWSAATNRGWLLLAFSAMFLPRTKHDLQLWPCPLICVHACVQLLFLSQSSMCMCDYYSRVACKYDNSAIRF